MRTYRAQGVDTPFPDMWFMCAGQRSFLLMSELNTQYSMKTIGMFAYGLHILNHSSLEQRDQRLSTGGVETRQTK